MIQIYRGSRIVAALYMNLQALQDELPKPAWPSWSFWIVPGTLG